MAAYIRDAVPHKKICCISNQNLEALAIRISPFNSPSFILAIAYRNNKDASIEPSFSNFLESCLENGNGTDDIIMMGDFNLSLLEVNSHTRIMDEVCQTFNLVQLIDLPTRITETTTTLIDHIYVTNSSLITEAGVTHLGISDHSGIYLCRSSNGKRKQKPEHLQIEFRDFKAFNETKFICDVNAATWHLLEIFDEIDDKTSTMYQLLSQNLDEHIP